MKIEIDQSGKIEKSRAHGVARYAVEKKIFNERFKAKDIIGLLKPTKKSGNA